VGQSFGWGGGLGAPKKVDCLYKLTYIFSFV